MARFKPPTLQEVQDYIREKNWFLVDPQDFFDYYEATEWHDQHDNPVRRWKGKVVTWHKRELRTIGKAKCATCGKRAVYQEGYDDTGCKVFRCEDHKPPFRPVLPEETTKNILKMVPPAEVKVSNERNRQVKALNGE